MALEEAAASSKTMVSILYFARTRLFHGVSKMAELWYYAKEGCKVGPFSAQELRGLANCGVVLPTDIVWKKGTKTGALARKVRNLFPPVYPHDTQVLTGSPPAKVPSLAGSPNGTPSTGNLSRTTRSACWYYAHDGKKIGPLSGRELKDLATSGRILPTDTVWSEGTEWGVVARKVKNLFPPGKADAGLGEGFLPTG